MRADVNPALSIDAAGRRRHLPRHVLALAPVALAVLLSACSLAPKYERPPAPVAADWPIPATGDGVMAGTPDSVTAASIGWRDFFRDPQLQSLIAQALENNRDLRVAVYNIEAARAQYNVQRAELAPSIGAGATGQRARTPGDLSPSGQSVVSSQYQVGVQMPAFEIDLFGRIRNLSEAALNQYLATEETRRNVQITLISQVAEAYLNLIAADVQIDLARRTADSSQGSYDLVQRRMDAGVASALELNQARTLLETARSNLYAAQRARLQANNALRLLTGGTEAGGTEAAQASFILGDLLSDVPAGLPSEVLLARPDVLASEHNLQAANANIGAARAAFFPSISLTALFGTASAQLSGLFGGGSQMWSFSPQIAMPIFAGGSLRGQLALAEARENIAVAQYEGTIQQAFREVSDALAGTATYKQQLQAEDGLVEASQRSVELSELRYKNGVDNFLAVQDAQRTLFQAQQQLVGSRLAEQANRVALYKALGGGWLESSPVPGSVRTRTGGEPATTPDALRTRTQATPDGGQPTAPGTQP
ncbi:efflux transporter outer membrane subunit [Verticiella sediminum]|uniref:efflux transporter outer membrane subunit n=1 Tax=Verticiella sediminum TaxID=1247510 RepID=UPI003CCC826B